MDTSRKKQNFMKKLSNIIEQAEKKGVSHANLKDIFINTGGSGKYRKEDTKVSKSIENSTTKKSGISKEEPKEVKNSRWRRFGLTRERLMYAVMFALGIICTVVYQSIYEYVDDSLRDRCFVRNNEYTYEIARPITQCKICRNMDSIAIEYGITPEEFLEKYAYNSVPVLIKDATRDWSAMKYFNFKFFQDLYLDTPGALTAVEQECQFFPYKTEFESLGEVFRMTERRANFSEGEKPWYIGWSNCHNEVKSILRKHYARPYFLPNNSESSTLDWLFMGGTGPGAHVHLDYVRRPSWQAQISGMKTWILLPPPECDDVCKGFNATMHKGDILVVDTNVWYHSTFVHPGEISISIGSEYD